MSPRTAIERAVLDAAALVAVCSPLDWPGGFVVADERLPPCMAGAAIGGGMGLAAALGHRGGKRAVLLDTRRFFATATPTPNELAGFESAACHEAAHALTAADATPERAADLLEAAGTDVPAYDAARVAAMHNPRWAAAYWLLVDRGAPFRRTHGAMLRRAAGTDLARYGFTVDDVNRATRGADLATPLRRLLAAGGPADTLLCSVLPNANTRMAAIVAAGIVREPQPTGAA
jgi:hypothetical protein